MKKNTQTGRSMIEMLGTLAIIGVLSVGGIAGFNTAITKHRTNDITDFLNRTTVLTQALLLNNNLTLASVQDTIDQLNSSYLATAVMCSSGYAVNMAGLPKGVCENFTDMADNNHYIDELKLFIGADCTPGSVSCTSDDENAISFIFDTNVLSDALGEDGFYWCENGTIQNKSGKVATCDCTESDEEFYYDSDEEAIAAMCTEREYYCFSNGFLAKNIEDPSSRDDDKEVKGATCHCTGSRKTYTSDEEAVAAMCRNNYWCSYGELWSHQGVVTSNCGCSGDESFYSSDEEAILNMCTRGWYYCTGNAIYNGKEVALYCECTNTGQNYSSFEDAAKLCTAGYYCHSDFGLIKVGHGTSYAVVTNACTCDTGYRLDLDTDEEAIKHICRNKYSCKNGNQLIRNDSDVVTDCTCALEDEAYYLSDDNAMASMCNAGNYACDSGHLMNIYDNAVVFEECGCTGHHYFDSDENAIEALCPNAILYQCSGGLVRVGEGKIADNCDCSGDHYFHSDEEAIAAICEEAGRPYQCSNNNLQVYDSTGGWYHVATCNCSSGSTTYYDSNEEAIDAMCAAELFRCVSENRIRSVNGVWSDYDCACEANATGLYKTLDEAIAPMCEGIKHYYCGSSGVGVTGGSIIYGTCNCKATTGSFSSDEEAILKMCQDGWYWCSSGAILVHGHQSGFYPGVTVTACNCVSTEYFFMSESEAIAAMCEEEEDATTPNPEDPSYYYCNPSELRKALNNGQSAYVSSCACVSGSTAYYDSDEEAIAAMCESEYLYYCSSNNLRIISSTGGWHHVTTCNCVGSSAYYNSDEGAIEAMCKTPNYGCTGGELRRYDNGSLVKQDCYCTHGKLGYYDSDEEAIAAMCGN